MANKSQGREGTTVKRFTDLTRSVRTNRMISHLQPWQISRKCNFIRQWWGAQYNIIRHIRHFSFRSPSFFFSVQKSFAMWIKKGTFISLQLLPHQESKDDRWLTRNTVIIRNRMRSQWLRRSVKKTSGKFERAGQTCPYRSLTSLWYYFIYLFIYCGNGFSFSFDCFISLSCEPESLLYFCIIRNK